MCDNGFLRGRDAANYSIGGELKVDKDVGELLFFTKDSGSVKVSATAMALLPDGTTQSVSAESQTVESIKPTVDYWNMKSATPRFNRTPPLGPTFIPEEFIARFFGDSNQPAHDGQYWTAKVSVDSPFVNNGVACFAQLITPNRTLVEKGGAVLHPQNYPNGVAVNGTEALDRQFPTDSWTIDIERKAGDSPAQTIGKNIDELCKEARAEDTARTWIMYQPPSKDGLATCWIPLEKYSWVWGATATQTKVGDEWQMTWNLGGLIGAMPTSGHSRTTEFPKWRVVQPGGATGFVR